MTERVHTKEQGLAAIQALGYSQGDKIISVIVTAREISVRRIANEGGGWAVVEDRTILKPDFDLSHQHGPDADVGPINTSSEAAREG